MWQAPQATSWRWPGRMVSVPPSNTTGKPLFVAAWSLFRLIESSNTAKNLEGFSCQGCLRKSYGAVES